MSDGVLLDVNWWHCGVALAVGVAFGFFGGAVCGMAWSPSRISRNEKLAAEVDAVLRVWGPGGSRMPKNR